ncbi:MAG: hypothetical protein JXR37_19375 [Kiritimatiellae bacterium]|nr:hypothetical protein [Kiritimatiellia bacterium]
MTANTDWFKDCGWGVFCHYLGAPPSSDGGAELTAEAWNAQVDAFDAEGLANQLRDVCAPCFFITLGQNSGHYLAPNTTYDNFVGIEPSKCSNRDLVSDLYEALSPHGIRLLVYLPSGAPAADPEAVRRLGWEWGFEGGWPGGWGKRRTGRRLAEFQRKWEAVIREWSQRWGGKVRGWWIDGCYFADEMYRHDDAPNFRSFAAAMKAGNPAAIVAFNPGVKTPIVCHTEHEHYTAGEVAKALPECPGRWVERNGHKAQYHILSYLGSNWCRGEPRFPDELVIGYTKHVIANGGVITWDVPIAKNGLIPQAFVQQLRALRAAPRA